MINFPYEVVVVGSGATGGVAALTLAESGVRVLVIEAGEDLTPKEAFGSEPLNTLNRLQGIACRTKSNQAQHPGYWKSNPKLYSDEKENPYFYPKDKPFLWTQGRQVGGRSLTWGGITLRLSNQELKASRYDGYGPEWPIEYSDLAPHYTEIEKRLKIHGRKDGLDNLPDGEFIEPLPFTSSEIDFRDRVQNKLGYKVINSRGFGPHDKGTSKWPKSSSRGSTLKTALNTGKVEILSGFCVERILLSQDRKSAKEIIVIDQKNGKRHKLDCKLIVLCASTIQSLRILLNSEEEVDSKGLIIPSGDLGCNLMDHISTCKFFKFPIDKTLKAKSTNLEEAPLSGAGSFFIPFENRFFLDEKLNFIRRYGIWGGINRFEPPSFIKRYPNTHTGFLIAHGEVLARKSNKVTLSSKKGKWNLAAPYINCEWGENELNMVRHMNKTIDEIINISGGKQLPFKDLINAPLTGKIFDNSLALNEKVPPPGYYIHEVGGAPMGSNETDSVTDPSCRLWRCKNILVVDGACWPTSAWQSPTLTMMALTRRACLKVLETKPY